MITLAGFGDEISPDLEIQMDDLAAEGISYIDLRGVGGKNVLQLTDTEAAEIKKRLDARGFKIATIASPIGKIQITADFSPHLKDFMWAIQLAKFFGTPYIRIFSFYIPQGENPFKYRDEILRRIKELTRIAEQEGVTLLLENEKRLYGDNGERARDILESIHSPRLRFAFDPANFVQSQVLPMTDAYPHVEPYIAYISVKDARINTGEVVPAGEGDAQIRQLFAALKKKNFSGIVSIEPHLAEEEAFQGFSLPEQFSIASRAVKKLLTEAGLQWNADGTTGKVPSSGLSSNSAIPSCPPAAPLEPLASWIPLTPLETMAQTDYDVIIVGSGAGGGAVLWRLCDRWRNNGMRVGMIEAGDLVLPTHASNLAILSGGRAEKFIANPDVTRGIGRTLPEFSGAKQIFALGGRTLQWGAVTPRMPLHVLARYPVPFKEMEIYYSIAERVMKVTKAYIQNGALAESFLNRLSANGFPEATHNPMAVDMKPTQYGEVHSNEYFSSISFLAEAVNLKPFDLAVKVRAVQVLTEQGKAVGIKVMSPDKKSYILRAKNVVVSASTLETPRLLLHSGIKGSAIGRFLIDHSPIRGTAIVNRKGFPEVLGPLGIMMPETTDRPYQLQMYRRGQPSLEEVGIGINGYGLVEPRAENRITLDPNRMDEYGVPMIRVHYSYTQKDLDVIREMTAGMRKVFFIIGATPISVDGQAEICLRPPGDDNHEAGSCRIGDEPATSAADRFGQIHGISGLYVADNSVLPYLGTNPTLTTVALAIRTADHIIRRSSQ